MSEREGVWMSLSQVLKSGWEDTFGPKYVVTGIKHWTFIKLGPVVLKMNFAQENFSCLILPLRRLPWRGPSFLTDICFLCFFLYKNAVYRLSNCFYYILDQVTLIQNCHWMTQSKTVIYKGCSEQTWSKTVGYVGHQMTLSGYFWIFCRGHPGLFCVRCQRHNYLFSLTGPFSERRT